jgi:hypothetical protein
MPNNHPTIGIIKVKAIKNNNNSKLKIAFAIA